MTELNQELPDAVQGPKVAGEREDPLFCRTLGVTHHGRIREVRWYLMDGWRGREVCK